MKIWTVLRDIALTLVGLGGIAHQELVGPVRVELLLVYTTLLGIPGAANILSLRRSPTGTESESSSSPAASSPSQSS